jgi:hypothetical protein
MKMEEMKNKIYQVDFLAAEKSPLELGKGSKCIWFIDLGL